VTSEAGQNVASAQPEAVVPEVQMTPRGMLKLAEWLVYCESIGWPRASMPELTRIWHEFRDENGELRSAHD
jgi:hypothetical protein